MGYSADIPEQYRGAADYVNRILKGAKPGELPVQQPTKYQFVINLKSAKALGLTIPITLLARVGQVIE
jgi:putative tryptophan/tyrosine transport system substrate-binding protein